MILNIILGGLFLLLGGFIVLKGVEVLKGVDLVSEQEANKRLWVGFLATIAFTWISGVRRILEGVGVQHIQYLSIGQLIAGGISLVIALRYLDLRITSRRTTDEVTQMVAREEQKKRLELIGELATGVSHDFNNILGVVNVYIALVKERITDAATLADLGRIEQATLDGRKLTRQMMQLGEPHNVAPEIVHVRDIVHHTTDLLYGWLPSNVRLRTRFTEQPKPVLINPGHLVQVMTNIVINAVEAMPDGGTLTIDIDQTEVKRSAYLCCRIEDTGIGMSEAMREKVFEPFFTSKPAGQGNGLGLASSYGLIKAAGGNIEVHTRKGEGTRFEILLPVAKPVLERSPM